MLDLLALEGRNWQPTSAPIPRKLAVVDLDVVSKAWTYFLYHTLDTNQSGAELIIMWALALYYLLNRRVMNVGHIISADMDKMAQSRTKKSLRYVTVILLLCRKAGVPEFTRGHIVNLTRPLDVGWIVEHIRSKAPIEEALET